MKLSLGTAQFGKKYGISNKTGKTTDKEIKKIFKLCNENKIVNIDTAITYHNVHKHIGQNDLSNFKISTKLPKLKKNKKKIKDTINKQVYSSLKNLNIKKINCLFLHHPNDLIGSYGKEIFNSMQELKNNKVINKIGISIYSIKLLNKLIDMYDFDVVQTPLNIIDRRILDTGMYDKLNKLKIEIEIRSIFLQGLLMMKYNQIPKNFNSFKEILLQWNYFLQENNLNSIDACISFVKSFKKIKRIIIGCENSSQLKEIINSYKSNINFQIPSISSTNNKLINPSLW